MRRPIFVIILLVVGSAAELSRGEQTPFPEIVLQLGHEGFVSAIAFSADDKYIFTFGDQVLKTWDNNSGLLLYTDDKWPAFANHAVALSSDGRTLAGATEMTTAQGGTFILWNRDSHTIINSIQDKKGATAIALSADGTRLAVAHYPTVSIWSLADHSCLTFDITLRDFQPYGSRPVVFTIAFNADQTEIATGINDRAVIWNASSGALVDQHALTQNTKPLSPRVNVTAVAFNRNGSLMIGTTDALLEFDRSPRQVTKLAENEVIYALGFNHHYSRLVIGNQKVLEIRQQPFTSTVTTLGVNANIQYGTAVFPDGKKWAILGAPDPKSTTVWDWESGREKAVWKTDAPVGNAVFVDNDSLAATDSRSITFWNLNNKGPSGELHSLHDEYGRVNAIKYCSGSKLLLAIDGASLRMWRKLQTAGREEWKETTPLDLPVFSRYLAISPDCLLAAVAGGFTTHSVTVFNLNTRKEIPFEQLKDNHQYTYGAVAFSPNGKLLAASTSRDAGILLWDAHSGKQFPPLAEHGGAFSAIGFSSDSRYLAYVDNVGLVSAWDLNTGANVNGHQQTSDHYTAVNFISGKHFFVTTGQNSGLTLWKIGSQTALATLFILPDKWLVLKNNGLFDSNSFDETKILRWRAPDDQARLYPLEILMRDYFDPGLLQRMIDTQREDPHVRPVLSLNRVQPLVDVRVEWADEVRGIARVLVKVGRNKETYPRNGRPEEVSTGVYDLRIFRDGQLVGWAPKTSVEWQLEPPPTGPRAEKQDRQRWREKTEVKGLEAHGMKELPPFLVQVPRRTDLKQVTFTAYAFNEDRVKSTTASATLNIEKPLKSRMGRAYVISVGVNRTESSPAWDLQYAANDARQMSDVVGDKLEVTKQFAEVVRIRLVSDEAGKEEPKEAGATRVNVQAVLDVLAGRRAVDDELKREIPRINDVEKAQPEDLVLLAFSSHGYTDDRGVFHMVLADIGTKTPQSKITPELQVNSLSSEELSGWLRDVDAGEMVMVVDSCHSAATVEAEGFKPGPMGSRGLGQMAYDKGMRILAASKSEQSAVERDGIKHGLLTYALVDEGLKQGFADFQPKDGKILISEWLAYGEQEVPKLFKEGDSKGVIQRKGGLQNAKDGYHGRRQTPTRYQQPVLFDFAHQGDVALVIQ